MNEMMKYLPPSPFSRHVSLTLFHMVETIESIEKLFVRQLHVFLLLEQMAANWTNADFGHQQTHQLGRDGRKRRNHGHTVHWWPVLPNETMETKKPWGSAPNGKNKQVKERIKKEKKKKRKVEAAGSGNLFGSRSQEGECDRLEGGGRFRTFARSAVSNGSRE